MLTLVLCAISDPVGDFSLSDLDTAVWIQSGQYPGSSYPFSPGLSEMTYIQDYVAHKDEGASTTSDMNDSTYMSQPDTSRRGSSKTKGATVFPHTQDSRERATANP